MNERIRELADQAGWSEDIRYAPRAKEIEMFAELIVRECAYIPIDMWDKAELNADVAVKIEDRIKQHFGVEE